MSTTKDGPVLRVKLDPTQTQIAHLESLIGEGDRCIMTPRTPKGLDLMAKKPSYLRFGIVGRIAIPYQVPFLRITAVMIKPGKEGSWYAYIAGYLGDPKQEPHAVANRIAGTKRIQAKAARRAAKLPTKLANAPAKWVQPANYKTNDLVVDTTDTRLPWED